MRQVDIIYFHTVFFLLYIAFAMAWNKAFD